VSRLIEIVEAVAAKINESELIEPVTAEVDYAPQFDLPDMRQLHVTVAASLDPKIPAAEETPADRRLTQHDLAVDVAVLKKIDDRAEVPPLIDTAEAIRGLLRQADLGDVGEYRWTGTTVHTLCDPEQLKARRMFMAVATYHYRIHEEG